MAKKRATTPERASRNRLIKRKIIRLMGKGYSLKEASYLMARWYYLSQRQMLRIYYETVLREGEDGC